MPEAPLSQLRMKRPNLDGLPPIPDLPLGFHLRKASPADAGILAELLGSAFQDGGWSAERVRNELLSHPDCPATFVVVHEGKAAATATLLLQPQEHPGSGTLHWVASDPSHRGKQLGLIVSLAVLHEARRLGCEYSLLLTDDFRLPAIKTYLKLGYEPDCWHDSHAGRWQTILENVR